MTKALLNKLNFAQYIGCDLRNRMAPSFRDLIAESSKIKVLVDPSTHSYFVAVRSG